MLDLSGLTPNERQEVMEMLCKEADAFLMNYEDVGLGVLRDFKLTFI